MRLLIAEDEKTLNSLIKKVLEKEGYSVDNVYNGQDAIDYIEAADYDACILDIMMPSINGFDVVKWMRQNEISTPVLFLTARDSIEDKVKGLDTGADDYLIKPFEFDELLARIRSITRKYSTAKSSTLSISDLTMDTSSHLVYRGETLINLSAREYSLLELLLLNKGRVLSRDQIEEKLYDFDYEGSSNVVDVYISFLRKKIDLPGLPKLIHTVRGTGWILKE